MAVACLVFFSLAAGCQKRGGAGGNQPGGALQQAQSAGVLHVGIDPTFPPLESKNPDSGQVEGFDVDLMNAIGKELGVKVDFITSPFDAIIPGLQSGKWDAIISALTITDERAKVVSFSDPYYQSAQAIIVRDSDQRIKTATDLRGKTLGVQLGTTGEAEAKKIPDAKIVKFDTGTTPFDDLMLGKVDAVIMDKPTAAMIIKVKGGMKIVGEPLTAESYGIAVRKDETKLLDSINAALKKLKDNGTIASLESQWLG